MGGLANPEELFTVTLILKTTLLVAWSFPTLAGDHLALKLAAVVNQDILDVQGERHHHVWLIIAEVMADELLVVKGHSDWDDQLLTSWDLIPGGHQGLSLSSLDQSLLVIN